jgi:hypothetical protein
VPVDERRVAARAGESIFPISTVMHLASEGPVLGAGTLVVAADTARRLSSLGGQEARVLALLSAAYNRAVPPSVLGNIERAAKSWREGDDSLAYIHLAHAGLPELQDPREAARRLFLADGLMKAGGKPRAIFEILNLDATFIDAFEKQYNPGQPRVPAGSGRISGRWTRLLSWLGNLTAAQRAGLGAFAARLGGWATVFGLLVSRPQTDSERKVRCPACRGCATSGIATRRCFILRTTALAEVDVPSQRIWKMTCSVISMAGPSAACSPRECRIRSCCDFSRLGG